MSRIHQQSVRKVAATWTQSSERAQRHRRSRVRRLMAEQLETRQLLAVILESDTYSSLAGDQAALTIAYDASNAYLGGRNSAANTGFTQRYSTTTTPPTFNESHSLASTTNVQGVSALVNVEAVKWDGDR